MSQFEYQYIHYLLDFVGGRSNLAWDLFCILTKLYPGQRHLNEIRSVFQRI